MNDTSEVMLDAPEDDALLARLRKVAAEADPAPAMTYELARAAFAMRTLDDDLAVLVHDSAEPGQELVGVRGADDVRLLSYAAPMIGLELQVVARGSRRSLTGQVIGPVAAAVVVETGSGEQIVHPDETGVFFVQDLQAGRVRMRLRVSDGVTVTTPWTAL